jgi:hypothetical protein
MRGRTGAPPGNAAAGHLDLPVRGPPSDLRWRHVAAVASTTCSEPPTAEVVGPAHSDNEGNTNGAGGERDCRPIAPHAAVGSWRAEDGLGRMRLFMTRAPGPVAEQMPSGQGLKSDHRLASAVHGVGHVLDTFPAINRALWSEDAVYRSRSVVVPHRGRRSAPLCRRNPYWPTLTATIPYSAAPSGGVLVSPGERIGAGSRAYVCQRSECQRFRIACRVSLD